MSADQTVTYVRSMYRKAQDVSKKKPFMEAWTAVTGTTWDDDKFGAAGIRMLQHKEQLARDHERAETEREKLRIASEERIELEREITRRADISARERETFVRETEQTKRHCDVAASQSPIAAKRRCSCSAAR